MRILLIGDVYADPGRRALRRALPALRTEYGADAVVVNGENAAGGLGITPRLARDIRRMGVDVITTGNHVWHKRDVASHLADLPFLLRPLNYPEGTPGQGLARFTVAGGTEVVVINLLGRVFLHPTDCPFRTAVTAIEGLPPPPEGGRLIVLDFHAEATSEKLAMGHFLDGRVAVVAGTHTHVQTADERILPGGTAYITDLGLTGARDSVIGHEKALAVSGFLAARPVGFRIAEGDVGVEGAMVEADPRTGLARSIVRFRWTEAQTPQAAPPS